MLELRVLGPLEVVRDGEPVPLPRQMHRALLALLVLHLNEVVSRDRLIEELWAGQPPATAKDALQNYVSQVRKAIGREVIVTRAPGYLLEVEPAQTDAGQFEQLVAEARAAENPETRAAALRTALALWRGPALADLAYESFVSSAAARLEDLRATAQEDLVDAELALGHHADLVPRLEELVDAHPYDERARAQLMLALYRSGRQAEALEAFQETRQKLADELGLDPSPALRELERAILLQEPSLVSPDGDTPAAAERRKTVTVLSAELTPAEEHDAERERVALVRGVAAARAAVERHEGSVTARGGEELLGVFGIPTSHEDDALRAVRAATEMREAIVADGALQLRVGIETGEVLTGHGFVSGDVTRVAARIQRTAKPGEILIGSAALGLVRHAVDGRRSRGGFRLEAVQINAPAVAQRAETPLVGRERELDALLEQFDETSTERSCRLVVLTGEPGIGKTRLSRELAALLDEPATVRVGRCVAYGEGASYLPLRELLVDLDLDAVLADTDERDLVRRRADELLRMSEGVGSIDETFWAVGRVVAALARERPLVLVLEDLHWAEARLLDFVDQLVRRAREPILVLATGRPELLDARPAWREVALEIEPLETETTRALVGALEGDLDPAVTEQVVDLAEGNPLFAEQLLAYVRDLGEPALDTVPPSIEALLAARIDLLDKDARSTAQRAALIGREFTREALAAIASSPIPTLLSAHLVELVRRGLVRPAAAPPGEELYRFHHVLIRDVAYAGLPKTDRAELHETYADWLVATPKAPDEVVGYHLEQAYNYRSELGPVDRRAKQLAVDAGQHLDVAGMRAFRIGDMPATTNLLGRAAVLLPIGDRRRRLLVDLGLTLDARGDYTGAVEALTEAIEESQAVGDRATEAWGITEREYVELRHKPNRTADDLLEAAGMAIPILESAGDHRAVGRALVLFGWVQGARRGDNAAWLQAAEQALDHYKAAGWSTSTCLGGISSALLFGATPVGEAIKRVDELLERDVTDQAGRAYMLAHRSVLLAQRHELDQARECLSSSQAILDELGLRTAAFHYSQIALIEIEFLAGRPSAAVETLRRLCSELERRQNFSFLASRAGDLAEALLQLGELDDACKWTVVAEERAAADDLNAQMLWRPVRARIHARRGEFVLAESLAREAIALTDRSDELNRRAKAYRSLAEVLQAAGDGGGATRALNHARGLYSEKENVVGIAQIDALRRDPAFA